jgi:ABC-type polysaccharide/polyol phosphate transport system ATPase subunit
MMDIIKADNLGINIKVFRKTRGSLKDTLADIFFPKRKLIYSFWALKGLNFIVEKGEVLGIIGRSGSGKSTLLRTIEGTYQPDEGKLEVQGTVSPLLTSTAGFKSDLSGLRNIYFYGKKIGFEEKEIETLSESIVSLADIGDFINRPVRTYTFDMYARLGFAISVNLNRDILLVDEALEAGDEKFKEKSCRKIAELLSEKRTIILISHHMETIKRFANRVIWLDDGKVLAQGNSEEIINQYLESRLYGLKKTMN